MWGQKCSEACLSLHGSAEAACATWPKTSQCISLAGAYRALCHHNYSDCPWLDEYPTPPPPRRKPDRPISPGLGLFPYCTSDCIQAGGSWDQCECCCWAKRQSGPDAPWVRELPDCPCTIP